MLTPTRKVTGGAVAGAVSILLVWLLGVMGIALPPEVSSAVTTLVTFVTSWFVKDAEN